MQQRTVVGSDRLEQLGAVQTACRLFRSEGVRGFYRGIVTHALRSTPQGALTLLAYEYVHRGIVLVGG